MNNLPNEILEMIFTRLDHKSLKCITRCTQGRVKALANLHYRKHVRVVYHKQLDQLSKKIRYNKRSKYIAIYVKQCSELIRKISEGVNVNQNQAWIYGDGTNYIITTENYVYDTACGTYYRVQVK